MSDAERRAEIEALAEKILVASATNLEMWNRMYYKDCFRFASDFLTARDEWRKLMGETK